LQVIIAWARFEQSNCDENWLCQLACWRLKQVIFCLLKSHLMSKGSYSIVWQLVIASL